jgi:hypothetical protein
MQNKLDVNDRGNVLCFIWEEGTTTGKPMPVRMMTCKHPKEAIARFERYNPRTLEYVSAVYSDTSTASQVYQFLYEKLRPFRRNITWYNLTAYQVTSLITLLRRFQDGRQAAACSAALLDLNLHAPPPDLTMFESKDIPRMPATIPNASTANPITNMPRGWGKPVALPPGFREGGMEHGREHWDEHKHETAPSKAIPNKYDPPPAAQMNAWKQMSKKERKEAKKTPDPVLTSPPASVPDIVSKPGPPADSLASMFF